MSSIEGLRVRISHRRSARLAVLAVLVVACGGTPAADESIPATPSEPTATSAQPTSPTSGQAETGGDGTVSDCSITAPATCGGSATLILDGETIVFDFFACYLDEDAEAVTGNSLAIFSAFGQRAQAGGPDSIVLTVSFSDNAGPQELVYVPDGDTGTRWYGDGDYDETFVREGGHVTYEGTFSEVADVSELTGQTALGSLEATCG